MFLHIIPFKQFFFFETCNGWKYDWVIPLETIWQKFLRMFRKYLIKFENVLWCFFPYCYIHVTNGFDYFDDKMQDIFKFFVGCHALYIKAYNYHYCHTYIMYKIKHWMVHYIETKMNSFAIMQESKPKT
jgi:hypothetical protein